MAIFPSIADLVTFKVHMSPSETISELRLSYVIIQSI